MFSEAALVRLWTSGEISPHYHVWIRQPYLTSHEIAALSLGVDPHRVDSKTFERMSRNDDGELSSEYMERRALVDRHIQAGELRGDTSPGAVLHWLQRMEIPTPDDFVAAFELTPASTEMDEQSLGDASNADLEERFAIAENRIRDLESENETLKQTDSAVARAAATNERNSLLKLVLGMAMGGYGYQPGERSGSAREIAGDAALNGISISEDTVRKYLLAAADEVSCDPPTE